jgi:hypothetical protein
MEVCFMAKLILFVWAVILLTSCATHRRSPVDIDRDKAEVVASLVRFWQAYERRDLATMSEMLTTSSDFTFFGSDAAEVVRTRRDWEELILDRFAITMRKESETWRIVLGMTAVATQGESTSEIVIRKRMKAPKK